MHFLYFVISGNLKGLYLNLVIQENMSGCFVVRKVIPETILEFLL